jgi:hypothetical protein
LATLAQAMSNTMRTAPDSNSNLGRMSPTTESSSEATETFAAQLSGILQGNSVSIGA